MNTVTIENNVVQNDSCFNPKNTDCTINKSTDEQALDTSNELLLSKSALSSSVLSSRCAKADNPEVFTNIYQERTNIAIWQRDLSNDLESSVDAFIQQHSTTAKVLTVTPENCFQVLQTTFNHNENMIALTKDITLLVDMFCCLFELKGVGLRLTTLDQAMCPRFHFDRIPCRLVTTYKGVATQWLDNDVIDRSKLGAGNKGKSDEESGLFNKPSDIKQLTQGDVALLKGEHWYKNEDAGLVHRSPAVSFGERRLLLTLDFIDG